MANPKQYAWLAVCCISSAAVADVHPTGIPMLDSNPGAAYTLYLDFGGFNFSGTWGDTGKVPGNVPAYGNVTGSFSAAYQDNIKEAWARAAQKYTPFNVNVTTVDPAIAANQAGTDFLRQAYYDQAQRLTHTVIADGTWYGAAGGVSYLDVASDTYPAAAYNSGAGAGYHTNWVFANYIAESVKNIGECAAHENGHTLGLYHQSDYGGGTLINEYSSGSSSYAPIMGDAYGTTRGAWRLGDSNNGNANHLQNDPAILAVNVGYVQDGIGHARLAATPLPLSGSAVDAIAARGVIVPASVANPNPNPIGSSNYTSDFFSFHADGKPITLTVNDGTEFLSSGVADPGATLRSTLTILDSNGNVIATGIEAPSTLSETYSGTLTPGDYFAEISSYGGATQMLSGDNTTQYYDMGAYFVTGSVPEPGIAPLFAVAGGLIARRRRG